MPRPLPTHPTRFVFAPGLYPKTPLDEKPVFVHGEIRETKERNSETIIRGKDEKGEWEAYLEHAPAVPLTPGQRVRGFGIVETQPDGKVVLAARWIKAVDPAEYTYAQTQTQKEWETLTHEHPGLGTLSPHVPPAPRVNAATPLPRLAKSETDEFVSASQFKVERDFV